MQWPPADTFRNRFLYRVAAGVAGLVTVYWLLFALQTGAFLPWAVFTVALAATLLAGMGLLLMHASGSGSAPQGGTRGSGTRESGTRRFGSRGSGLSRLGLSRSSTPAPGPSPSSDRRGADDGR